MCWKRLEKRAMMHTLNKRQGKWNGGGMLRGDSKNGHRRNNRGSENIARGRQRQMMLDWTRSDGYGMLKEEAQQRRSDDVGSA